MQSIKKKPMISHSISCANTNRANNVENTVNDLEVSHKKQMSQLVQPSGEEAPPLSKQCNVVEGHGQVLEREREEQEKIKKEMREEKNMIARHHK